MRVIDRINGALEMPKEIYTKEPKIVTIGFKEFLIENYKSILEYDDCFVKLETYIGFLNIHGTNIKLDKMTEDNIKIIGKIESIDIERK